jgi:DNA ligase (NAD+)
MPEVAEVSQEGELRDFDAGIRASVAKDVSFGYTVEPDIEGLAVEMVYERGTLTAASTRGDGRVGELVTANVKTILTVPLTLFQLDKRKAIPDLLEVRGVVYMEMDDFRRQMRQGYLPESATIGEAAVHGLMQPNPRVTAKHPFNVFCSDIGEMAGPVCQTHDELMSLLQLWGIRVNRPHIRVFQNMEGVTAHCRGLVEDRAQFPYPVGGAVIKVNEMELRKHLGEESGRARWAIVFKF